MAAEAKAFVGAIFRGADSGFKRLAAASLEEGAEPAPTGEGVLCKPAPPIPDRVPKAESYLPSSAAGEDYNTGDDKTGWKCLDVSNGHPQHCQVSYAVGSGYKSVARGGPDPGPNGVEASAECDADGNGKTSLYARTGTLKDGLLEGSPELFVADDGE